MLKSGDKNMKELKLLQNYQAGIDFKRYEQKFKALADEKRLQIIHELCVREKVCVCDLCEIVEMKQSKLSYHLKILLDANLILKETEGTWSYYTLNNRELEGLLSDNLCCIFLGKA